MERMIKGRVHMGTDAATHSRWINDNLEQCSIPDRIWGWSIRSTEILHHERAKIDDTVLRDMLYLALLDAGPANTAWTEPTNIKQGLRLTTNATVRLLHRVLKADDKVGHPGRFLLMKLIQLWPL